MRVLDPFDVTKIIFENFGAAKAGLKKGDIIIKIDNRTIATFADLNGYINSKRPNDEVQVTFMRGEKRMTTPVILSKNDVIQSKFKGMELENLNSADKAKFKIKKLNKVLIQ